ncbi:MAG: TRAP transporter fused permease subunit [Alphaproteobacteria bacterium]|nr:MAG: TRAP transporter fused permease subunit [Alphaproteobacteria bacterium]
MARIRRQPHRQAAGSGVSSRRAGLFPGQRAALRRRGVSGTRAGALREAALAALGLAVAALAILWALDLPQELGFLVYPEQVAGLMLGLGTAAVFLRAPPRPSAAGRVIDPLLALGALWIAGHVFLRFPVLSEGAFFHPGESLALGALMAVVILPALLRVAGPSLALILGGLVIYALISDHVPGRLQGRPVPWDEILAFLGTDSTATLGAPLQVAAFVVVLFILFGRLLVGTGGAEVLTDAARRIAGTSPGATAKMAVIASGFMGSISGSAVSNVMTTGVVTIPAMRRAGFSAERAGAIEAVASTGGQLLPPVMGAAAFLMAEFLRLPYQEIILAALIPALLFYYAIYLQIGLLAARDRLGAGDAGAAVAWAAIGRRSAIVLGPMAMLLVGLFAFNMPAGKAVVWASAVLVALGLGGLAPRRIGGREVLRAIAAAGRDSAQILLVCAVAGMIIGLMSTSGFSFGLSFVLLDLGRGSLTGLLLLTAAVSILLGMGLPTTGVYLLLATLAAPPLVRLGIGELEAHFFVLYFGLMSMITPPVALAAFAAASVAGASPMATAMQSLRFGWIAFILPFVFVHQPGLLMRGSAAEVALAAVVALVAVPLVTAAIVGFGRRRLSWAERAGALALGVVCILPHGGVAWLRAAEMVALALGLGAIGWHLLAARRGAAGSGRG